MKLNRILESCLYVRDLNEGEKFYTEIMGLALYSKAKGRHIFFRLADMMLLIFNPDKTMEIEQDVPPHGSYGEGHIAFTVSEAGMPEWREHLQKNEIEIEKEITWPNGGHSIYFRDPGRNSVELVTASTWRFER